MLTRDRICEIASDYFWSRVYEAQERGVKELNRESVGMNLVDCAWFCDRKYASEDMTAEDCEEIYFESLRRF